MWGEVARPIKAPKVPLRVVNDVLGVYKKRIKWAFYEEGFQPWALVGGTGYVGYDSWRVKGVP